MPYRCCNPFSKLNRCTGNLRKVTDMLASSARHIQIQLTCGVFICDTCRIDLLSSGGQTSHSVVEIDGNEIYSTTTSTEETISTDSDSIKKLVIPHLNAAATHLHISPIKKRKLRSNIYKQLKGNQLSASIAQIFNITPECQTDSEKNILNQLKEKYNRTTSKNEKFQILTTLPSNWTISNIMSEFNCTYHTARTAKNLQHDKGIMCTPDIMPKIGLSDEVVEAVKNFYEHDDISRVFPGKRDYKTTTDDGTKVTKQKRLVLCSLKEVYQQFKTEFPELKVGFSKFSSLRPPQCMFANIHGTHSVCVCKTHQNVKLMFDALKRQGALRSTGIDTYHDCLKTMLCEDSTDRCHKVCEEKCNFCPGINNLQAILTSNLSELEIDTLSYKQWINVDRCALETITKSQEEFIEQFCAQLEALVPHAFIAKKQSEFLKETKTKLEQDEFVVISDFAENYSFVVQDEIQGFHWSNAQCTIHPFVIYFKGSENELQHKCFVIIAESLKHNHTAVYLFQKKLISFMKNQFNIIKKITFFSDGAGSQYKSRKNFFNLSEFKIQYGFDCEWHFFATSHGKGPCDGIGGSLKRLASRTSLQRPFKDQIMTAKALFDWAKSAMPNTAFDICTTEEHLEEEDFTKNKYNNVKAISGTHKYHAFIPSENNKYKVKKYSLASKFYVYKIKN